MPKINTSKSKMPSKTLWVGGSVGLVAIAIVCGGLAFYVQPKLEAESLGRMALKHDYVGITKQIDYSALKVNMAHNLHRIISQNNVAHHMNLKPAIITAAANNGAAHMATPSGVTALLKHTLPALGQHIGIVRYTGKFLGLNRYYILVTGDTGGHVGAVFYRQGLFSWKLGDIQMFPPHMPLNAYPVPATLAQVRKESLTILPMVLKPPMPAKTNNSAPVKSAK